MKSIYLILLLCLVSFSFVGCGSSGNSGQVIVNSSQPSIGENLDLRAVGEVIKNSRNPQEIEQKLNADDGINNLDLDGDGNRDYLKVTEYGQGSEHGYSICAVLKDGEPEVANVVVNTATSQMTMNGNSQYYGNNNTYQSSFTTTDFLLLSWLMRPNYSYYHSPYHYGYYGYGYGYRPVVSYHTYSSRPTMRTVTTTRTYRTVSAIPSTNIKSPNSNNTSSVATKRVSNFSNASTSQKSFSTRPTSSTPRSSWGFGSSKSSGSSSSSSSSGSYKPSSSGSSSSGSSYKSSSPSRSSGSGFGSSSKSSGSSRRK